VAAERFTLAPSRAPLASAARLGAFRYFGTLYVCRVGAARERWAEAEERMGELAGELERDGSALFGCSVLPAHGLVVRALATSRRAVSDGFERFWTALRRDLDGERAIPPRKTR
jgi:urease accessory protein UreH